MYRVTAALICLLCAGMEAALLPPGFSESFISGLGPPTAMAFLPDGRLLVCQQNGQLRIIKNGQLLSTPFLTVTVDSTGERGLLGVVANNEYVYIYYTVPAIGSGKPHNRLSRFEYSAGSDVATGPEQVLENFEDLSESLIHNGGALHFSPIDGKLYVALGENAKPELAQPLDNRLGKILRLNADATIPGDNPLVATTTGKNQAIWARGLRNPFTFAFQPGTGRMLINDVGDREYEEINDGLPGANYGWSGTGTDGPRTREDQVPPFFYYPHSDGCAITGGTFYNPAATNFPAEYVGKYFFADHCRGWIRTLDVSTKQASPFALNAVNVVDLDVGPNGSLWYLVRGENRVYRVDFNQTGPTITGHPVSQTVAPGEPVTFAVTVTGTGPFSYQWQRNQVDIPGANGPSFSIGNVQPGDHNAVFRVVVTNSAGTATSNPATLTIGSAGNTAPSATILTPVRSSLYAGGDTIQYSGTGSDAQDGVLPASAFCWWVDFHHDTHTHPFLGESCGSASGSVTIPTSGEIATNVWYRFYLRVRDSGYLTQTTFVDVLPRVVTITLNSTPGGLRLTVDGRPVTAPYSFSSVAGILRSIGAETPQGGLSFTGWSDGGAATHAIATPSSNRTYTAAFQGTCSYTLSRNAGSYGGAGDLGRIRVSSEAGCIWAPATAENWITLLSPAGGSGNGVVVFRVEPNVSSLPRSGTLQVAGQQVVVMQAGNACSYKFTEPLVTAVGAGGVHTAFLETAAGCTWTLAPSPDWITLSSAASGAGPATISFVVGVNNGGPRMGTIQVAGQVLHIVQNATAPAAPYNDVPVNYLFATYLSILKDNGIAVECSPNNYCPEAPILRREMAVFLVRAVLGGDPVTYPTTPFFTDIPSTHPQFAHIQKLAELGITNGCTATTFCPNDSVTRGQMAAFLIRARTGLTATQTFPFSNTAYFADVPASNVFFGYIQKLRDAGITTGCNLNAFCVNDVTLRGQMSAFVDRAFLAP